MTMTSILTQPAIQIAALVLSGLFFLNQTRKQGLILSLLCLVACLGVVVIVVDTMAQEKPDLGAAITKRIIAAPRSWLHIVINETEFVESEPIIETVTEQEVIVTPNEDPVRPAELSRYPAPLGRYSTKRLMGKCPAELSRYSTRSSTLAALYNYEYHPLP